MPKKKTKNKVVPFKATVEDKPEFIEPPEPIAHCDTHGEMKGWLRIDKKDFCNMCLSDLLENKIGTIKVDNIEEWEKDPEPKGMDMDADELAPGGLNDD